MEDKEEFGKITIDDQPAASDWNKPIPYLGTSLSRSNAGGMTKDQLEFYQYLKDSVKRGKHLSSDNVRHYVYLYAEELCNAYKGHGEITRSEALQQIINLVTIYNVSSYYVNEIIEKEENRLRLRRLNSHRIKDKSYWVPIGQELTVDGRTLVRGGFYWGKYVEFYQYSPKTKNYTRPIKIEGPALCPIPIKDNSKLIKGVPNSFVELSDLQQESLFNWLAGSNEINLVAMAVYLSGFEVRLFGDRSISDEERTQDILYLHNLMGNLPVILDENEDADGGSAHWQKYVTKWITDIIDFTLARYYMDNPPSELPSDFVDKLPILMNARIDQGLENIDVRTRQESELAEDLKRFVKPPHLLPEVFHQAFYEKLAYEYKNNANWRQSDFGILDRNRYKYAPITFGRHYRPSEELSNLLSVEPIKHSKALGQVAEKLKLVYARIMRSLNEYKRLVDMNAPLLVRTNALPSWCDTSLMPEIQEMIEELRPSPDQRYKLMKVSELTKYFLDELPDSEGLDEWEVNFVRMCLYRVGLSLAYPTSATMKLKFDDITALYDNSHHEVPNRGTIQTSMFLIAWMVQAENVTEADYQIIDQWLRSAAKGANWDVSAEAVMRWLINHKLTMTAKRKIRARALSKFTNKRDLLQELLLVLVNGEGFVLPKRLKRLEAIYELIGLDPSTIHSDLHRLATEGSKVDAATSKSSKSNGTKGKVIGSGGMLNRDKLKEMAESTAKAQEILADVFTQDTNESQVQKKAPRKKKKADSIVTLIEKLAQKSQWSRSEFEELISDQGETYGAMLEKLNDYSYDKVDEALVEDEGETVYVDTDVADMLLE